MKIKSSIFLLTALASVLALSSCATSYSYDSKGRLTNKDRRPDPAFWSGASRIAQGYIVSQTATK